VAQSVTPKLDEIIFAYKGDINRNLLKNIIKMADAKLEMNDESRTTRKRVGAILIECLENIINHADVGFKQGVHSAILMIRRVQEGYNIQVGNIIPSEIIEILRNRIDRINSMTPAQLKDYYNEIMTTTGFSSKGGAGLGFIDIAKKALNNQINYEFRPIDPDFAFFTSNVTVQSTIPKS
jgi:hypothetical protein